MGVWRFATAFPAPGHVAIIHLEGFKTAAKHGPPGYETLPWAFSALPVPSQVSANTLPCSGSPLPAPGHVAMVHLEGFQTAAKHGPPGHETLPWAFSTLPVPSQVSANTLPCSGSPFSAPGHVAMVHLEGFQTAAKHGPPGHETLPWAFSALPLPFFTLPSPPIQACTCYSIGPSRDSRIGS